jgi:phosphate transport system protein
VTKEHIVKSFDEELGRLDNLIAEMGGLAETQLAGAIEALVKRDLTKANEIRESDRKIDAIEAEIDQASIRLLALRQPMAVDLRIIVAALKISHNLERIGDYAKNVAKRTGALVQQPPTLGGATNTVARMGRLVQGMIKNVLDAYIARDARKADDVRARDREVDQLHTSLFRELLTHMMEDPRNITACTHLLFIAKNVERIGDHATSIAEQVHFFVHGKMPPDERLRGDESSFTVVEPEDAKKD